jgi:hypothetical protein
MKLMLMAGLLITLPAISVGFFFFGKAMMIPAMVSLAINFLPFVLGGLLINHDDEDMH